jgi:hypothetical protein
MKPIKDASGKVIAYENDVSSYRQEIRSRSNSLLGWHNSKEGPEGKTHDRSGRVIGSGDQRGRLIPDE